MDLLCCERESDTIIAEGDSAILNDDRVLERLLSTEDRYAVTCNYFRYVQKELNQCMRKICVSWMMEVCEEENCEDAVFPMAVNYLDRFLAVMDTRKQHLQLIACVCLLMATKIRQTWQLNSVKLSYYTDYTYTPKEIVSWELLVLGKLRWDVSAILPVDFLDPILLRLPLDKFRPLVRKHAHVFLQLCTLEFKFCSWTASLVALGCVGAAINGLPNVKSILTSTRDLANIFQEITAIEANIIEHSMELVEEHISSHVLEVLQQTTAETNSSSNVITANTVTKHDDEYYEEEFLDQQPETPTDVQDVIV